MTCLCSTRIIRPSNNEEQGTLNSRSLGVTEPRPLYHNPGVSLLSLITYLSTDMLALTITIRPDEQNRGASRLSLNIVGYGLLVLGNCDLRSGVK